MLSWIEKSDALFEAEPNKSSRFMLQVKARSGKWFAFVSEEAVSEGEPFGSLAEAQRAAEEEYDSYWSDFEAPLE